MCFCRLLTVEEKERLQKEEKLNKADKNIALAMEELNNYRSLPLPTITKHINSLPATHMFSLLNHCVSTDNEQMRWRKSWRKPNSLTRPKYQRMRGRLTITGLVKLHLKRFHKHGTNMLRSYHHISRVSQYWCQTYFFRFPVCHWSTHRHNVMLYLGTQICFLEDL